MAALNLSNLKTGLAYPLESSQSSGKCLIHMKLTDLCTRSIDALVNSTRGAVFSLRFSENGGTMVIPVDNGEPRKFQFKTASNQSRSEGQNILECVHQATGGSHSHKLSCTGPIEHRLTVQANDTTFNKTKERVKEVEQKRKEAMAQEIKLPTKGRSKKTKSSSLKAPQSAERTTPSPTFRKPVKPTPPKSTSSTNKSAPGGARMNSHTKLTAPVRVSHSLKERVVHFLALKPQRRDEVLTRIRKETKKSEASLSAMIDTILGEVSEVSSGNHKLKTEYVSDLQIEEWPHYSDAERQLMRRRYGKSAVASQPAPQPAPPPPTAASKRVLVEPEPEIPSKKPKLEHPLSSAHKPHPPPVMKEAVKIPDPLEDQRVKGAESQIKKEKKVKKKKKKREKSHHDSAVTSDPLAVTSDPSSTTNDTPDFKSEFPPIQTDQQKAFYKQIFNNDYTMYIELKESIDLVSTRYQSECATLSEKLSSLSKHSDEGASIRRLIRAKYSELQQNKVFLENKRRFQELHEKLDHIKKQVVEYDKSSSKGTTL